MGMGEEMSFETMTRDEYPDQEINRNPYPLEEIGQTLTGYTIWRQKNSAGGYSYWSDAIGGGVMVWDTCLASVEELLFCMEYEKNHP